MEKTFIKGKYFTYCQWCKKDGRCVLRHFQFLGMKSAKKIDRSSYPGHEDLRWHGSAFQKNSSRGMCAGRISETGSIFYPLQCECGTVISSMIFSVLTNTGFCAKFQPNKNGEERLRIAKEIAKKQKIAISKVNPNKLPRPDENYSAAMTC
jgi:hypothetical protein